MCLASLRDDIRFVLSSIVLALFVVLISCACAAFPDKAWATVEGDQTPLSDEEIAEAVANGEVKLYSEDLNISTTSALSTFASSSDPVQSFSGADRYETSAMQALAGWSSCDTAILVTGERWPDALSVSGLAGALGCPVLLTPQGGLSDYTSSALKSLGVEKVIVIGDENSVGQGVVKGLSSIGISVEARLGGSDRYETQLLVYRYGAERGLWSDGPVVVASGSDEGFADVLSISPAAYAAKLPVFLADGSGSLSSAQKAEFSKASFSGAVVLGQTNRVSSSTASWVSGSVGGSCKRIAGSQRYATSALIAQWAVSKGYLSWDGAAFAAGYIPYDSLGGGALQGELGSVLLLVDDGCTGDAASAIKSAGGVDSVKFFGDTPSVSMKIRMDLADRFGIAWSELDGLSVYLDAGHGWNSSNNGLYDSGAQGSGYSEAELTKELANLIANELRAYGISVHVNDYGGLYKLRQAEAERLGCDLLVSIHFNAIGGGVIATGSETYIHSYNAAWKSTDLQDRVHSALVSSMGLRDRGQCSDELAVLNGNVPAVLCEVCFIDNPNDMKVYQNRKYDVARSIAASIAS